MFKTFSGNPDITNNDVSFKSALINKCDTLTLPAVTKLVTPLSECNDIIGKMTHIQIFNIQMKTAKSRHPVAAFGGRECFTLSNGSHYRPRRFGKINSGLCYACGKV